MDVGNRLDFFPMDSNYDAINPYQTVVRVIGAGGAGNNTIHHLMQTNLSEIQTIAVNTDAQDLLETQAHRKVLLGKSVTNGLGTGGDPALGERSAEESKPSLIPLIDGTDILFLTGGLGGGTGTGSLPVIAGLAREKRILTVAIVTMPFADEGIIRWENAQIGLEKLRKKVDTLIVLKNDRLLELYPDLPFQKAFLAGDQILINALLGLSNLILKKGMINLDFADINTVLRDGPNTLIGLGESNSENRVEEALRRAIQHPMMETNISGAQSVLVHVTGGSDMTLKDARSVIHNIAQKIDPNAKIIWGVTIDQTLSQTLRVLLIVSGLKEQEIARTKEIDQTSAQDMDASRLAEPFPQTDRTIFDIKESILHEGPEVTIKQKPMKPLSQTALFFYKIFEEEALGDLKRFDRAVHFLRENLENRRALIDARQSCQLLNASAQMFGFDEISQLLSAIDDILKSVQSRQFPLSLKMIDSISLAMEMVVELIENRNDGKGETGYIVDRLKELKESPFESMNPLQS